MSARWSTSCGRSICSGAMYCGVPITRSPAWVTSVTAGVAASVSAGPSVAGASQAHQLGQAEVGDLHLPGPVEQDVLGLDVAMDDAMVVCVLEGVADLRHDGQGFPGLDSPASSSCRRLRPSTYSMMKK